MVPSGAAHRQIPNDDMRAIVLTAPGPPSVLVERRRPTPAPHAGQIRVRVHASALNRADLLQRRGAYPAPPGAPPDIPGLEYAGEVDRLGNGVTRWRDGDRVMGIVGGGGHAEYVVVHEHEAIPMPDRMTFEHAAAIPEVFLTAYDALTRQARVTTGERVLIHAVGSGVGTAAVQLARADGLTTYGTSRSAEKRDRAHALGLEHAVDSLSGRWADDVLSLTRGEGVHVILDLVGGEYLGGNVRVLARRGRLVLIGLTAGARAELDMGLVLRKRLHIIGTVLRSRTLEEKIALARAFTDQVVPLFSAGRLRPVVDAVYSFGDIRVAHERLEANESFGKLVLRWP
jgi:NADPH:quinone reductase